MPRAIAATLVAVTGTVATGLFGPVIGAVIAFGVAAGTNAIFGQHRPKPGDGHEETREAIGSRYRSYGIVCSGEQASFLDRRDSHYSELPANVRKASKEGNGGGAKY